MKNYKYEVVFSDGSETVYSTSPYKAFILASARRIESGGKYAAQSVYCTELARSWAITDKSSLITRILPILR